MRRMMLLSWCCGRGGRRCVGCVWFGGVGAGAVGDHGSGHAGRAGEQRRCDQRAWPGRRASATADAVRRHAFLWQNGKMTDLGTLGGHDRRVALNERGQVIGHSDTASGGVVTRSCGRTGR